jgi:hypothetical protein
MWGLRSCRFGAGSPFDMPEKTAQVNVYLKKGQVLANLPFGELILSNNYLTSGGGVQKTFLP